MKFLIYSVCSVTSLFSLSPLSSLMAFITWPSHSDTTIICFFTYHFTFTFSFHSYYASLHFPCICHSVYPSFHPSMLSFPLTVTSNICSYTVFFSCPMVPFMQSLFIQAHFIRTHHEDTQVNRLIQLLCTYPATISHTLMNAWVFLRAAGKNVRLLYTSMHSLRSLRPQTWS